MSNQAPRDPNSIPVWVETQPSIEEEEDELEDTFDDWDDDFEFEDDEEDTLP